MGNRDGERPPQLGGRLPACTGGSFGLAQDRLRPPFWILDSEFWILDSGFSILDSGFWILDSGF
jgi:hypothetical protein